MPFSRLRKGAFCIILNPRLNEKPGTVHLYWQLMACGDSCLTFQGNGRQQKSEGGLLPGGYGFI